jgi:hypothetical protein
VAKGLRASSSPSDGEKPVKVGSFVRGISPKTPSNCSFVEACEADSPFQ